VSVRVDIISGFLGAGKTTLIMELLRLAPLGARIAVCENEFGRAGIDAAILKNDRFPMLELNAGCVCCSLSGELTDGLIHLIQTHRPDRILLEPTGLAHLPDLLRALNDGALKNSAHIGSVISLLDASAMYRKGDLLRPYYESQLSFATLCALNRTDNSLRSR
jgi:G3E family GTPase